MTIKKIGIFDSGHGGLEILQYLAARHPSWEFVYTADLEFMPYGDKGHDIIVKRCFDIVRELLDQGCQAIVVACNTATAVAIDEMREIFSLPIVGIEPYLNYINKVPERDFKQDHLGALVTVNTFQSERFKKLKLHRDPKGFVKVFAAAGLATLVEELIAGKDLPLFKTQLSKILNEYRSFQWREIILGCTHYPLISEFISSELGVKCISPTPSVAAQLEKQLGMSGNNESSPDYVDCSFSYLDTRINTRTIRKLSDILFWRY